MGNTPMTDWLSINSLAWSLLRVATVWLAFYGAGSLITRVKVIRKYFGLIPSVIAGMLLYMGILLALSLFHLLTRSMVPVFVTAGAATGLILLYLRLRKYFYGFRFRMKHPLIILPLLLAGYILLTNIMLAGRPEMNFNDTQVTYLVQPDRWLNDGRMTFLDEAIFSAYPMTSEMLLVLPSSLSEDRIDQMILGQLFEYSMVIALILLSMTILGFNWKWFPSAIISIAGCSTILLWGHFAKPDATALFFVTIALVILFKQITDSEYSSDLSSLLVMSLALTSKVTSYITLVLFLAMYAYHMFQNKTRKHHMILAIFALVILPLIFAVRTFVHTGTLFYPYTLFGFLLKPQWRMPELHLSYYVFNDRSSYLFPAIGFFQNIWHYFGTWNSSIFLLLSGYILTLNREFLRRRTIILAGFAVYSIICIVLFYPAWWGAKYGILLIPFATVFGLYMFRSLKHGLVSATVLAAAVYFVYDTSISPTEHYGFNFRNGLMKSYMVKDWTLPAFQFLEKQPELKATLWMNRHLPANSTILSFYVTKRYFSNHRWINAWQYPVAAQLYLDNCLVDEVNILKELNIDYIIVLFSNPAPFDDENSVELFTRIGPGDVLEPVVNVDKHVIYRFCPENM